MTMTRKTTSPLSSLSVYFREKSAKTGGIMDNVDEQCIELYPAGYSKPSRQDGCSRQKVHEMLFKAAKELGTHEQLYPFDAFAHNIVLVPEPSNQYDPHAVKVILNSQSSLLAQAHGMDLGYVPKKISRMVATHIRMFGEGRIYKVREKFHDKYYSAKVILGYGDHKFISHVEKSLERFVDLLED